MTLPLMPKATAVWLVENTTLTFDQIAQFCGMHPLEIQGIADGDVAPGIIGENPVTKGLISQENLDAAQEDADVPLKLNSEFSVYMKKQEKVKNRYTPVARRQDKPDAIAWLIKNHPDMKDAQIAKLIGTTKQTILAIRNREHWNMNNIRPRDPVLLGLCTQTDLTAIVDKIEKAKAAKAEKKAKKSGSRFAAPASAEEGAPAEAEPSAEAAAEAEPEATADVEEPKESSAGSA